MTDEQVVEYLRSRGRVETPDGLTRSVMEAVAHTSPPKRSLVAVPLGTAAVIGTLLLVVVALGGSGTAGDRATSSSPTLSGLPASQSPAPSASPSHGASDSPTPLPSRSADRPTSSAPPQGERYVAVDGFAITVLDHREADLLFAEPDRCISENDYTVLFPDAWYTNTQTGDVAACSWFSPDFFEVTAPGTAPDAIWIELSIVDGTVGYTSLTDVFYNEQLSIAGREARRVEFNPEPTGDPRFRVYHYVIPLGRAGPTFVAYTDNRMADDYELAKAVLDRLVASLGE